MKPETPQLISTFQLELKQKQRVKIKGKGKAQKRNILKRKG